MAQGELQLTEPYRRIFEKFLLAYYLHLDSWDGGKYRKSMDECLAWLLEPGDTETLAYLQYEYLRGRDPDFIPYVAGALALGDEARARELLWSRYGAQAERGIRAARARGGY